MWLSLLSHKNHHLSHGSTFTPTFPYTQVQSSHNTLSLSLSLALAPFDSEKIDSFFFLSFS